MRSVAGRRPQRPAAYDQFLGTLLATAALRDRLVDVILTLTINCLLSA